MKSPFILSKQAQENLDKKRAEEFNKEYLELCEKHSIIHIAVLNATANSLKAVIALQKYEPDTNTKIGETII